jgi:hypothetical protein
MLKVMGSFQNKDHPLRRVGQGPAYRKTAMLLIACRLYFGPVLRQFDESSGRRRSGFQSHCASSSIALRLAWLFFCNYSGLSGLMKPIKINNL